MLKNLYYYSIALSLSLLLSSPMCLASDKLFIEKASMPEKVLFTAKYKGKLSGFNISMVRKLTRTDEGDYILESKARNLFASIEEISRFALLDTNVKAGSYNYKRSIAGRKTYESINFNWQTSLARYTRSDRDDATTEHKITPKVLDPSLYQLMLQADSALKSDVFNYSFVRRKRIENYTFKKLRDETIEVGGKEYVSVVLIRESKNKQKRTMVWIVPKLNYQIGKIEHTSSKGSTYNISLQSYSAAESELTEFYQQLSAPLPTPTNAPKRDEKSTSAL